MINKIIEELEKLGNNYNCYDIIGKHITECFDYNSCDNCPVNKGFENAIKQAIETVKKHENDGWVDSDFAIPSFDNQKNKIYDCRFGRRL